MVLKHAEFAIFSKQLTNSIMRTAKEVFNTLNEMTKSYIEIKEEITNFVKKEGKKIRKEKADKFFLLKRKDGEKLDMYDLRLSTAARRCFKEPKVEEVLKYKKVKMMEEIEEDIKDQLKISTVTMEEPEYDQLIEILSKLEEIKMKKEQQTKILKTSLEVKNHKNNNSECKLMEVRPQRNGMNERTSNRRTRNKKCMEDGNYCTYCHRRNHNYMTCYLRLGTCFNCSKNGHLSLECPQKKGNTVNSKYNYKMENKYRKSNVEKR